ncbi:MAG: hypothetical protein Fur0021_05370 [Candidatus Promineifilaceae bacterium]
MGSVARLADAIHGNGEGDGGVALLLDSGDALAHLGRRHGNLLVLVNCTNNPAIPTGSASQRGGTVAANPDRNARLLDGARRKSDVVYGLVGPVMRDRFAQPETGEYV